MAGTFEAIRLQYSVDYGKDIIDPFAQKPVTKGLQVDGNAEVIAPKEDAADPAAALKAEVLSQANLLLKKRATLISPISVDVKDIISQCVATPAFLKSASDKETRLIFLNPALFSQVTKRPQLTPASFMDVPFPILTLAERLEGSLGPRLGSAFFYSYAIFFFCWIGPRLHSQSGKTQRHRSFWKVAFMSRGLRLISTASSSKVPSRPASQPASQPASRDNTSTVGQYDGKCSLLHRRFLASSP
jgi:hypothetical protein